ncbi:hypothetical protein [Amycolatopsis thermoflava]|uniref:hypothetical protein n=1 Tax=Amycolatopsis thermoflava TaxID=84480 RepID=UPI0011CD9B7D|nr:hypothetical protein [Amycolatopsis thermoflava]
MDEIAAADPEWADFHRLRRDAWAVLNDRSALVHSLVVEVASDDLPAPTVEIWHGRSGTTATQPTPAAIEEHAFDIRRCFIRAVRLIGDAKCRFQTDGPLQSVHTPKLLDWQTDQEG